MKALLAGAALIACSAATPASAVLLNFSWVSSNPSQNFTFQMDSNPTPTRFDNTSTDVQVQATGGFGTGLMKLRFFSGDWTSGGFYAVPVGDDLFLTFVEGIQVYSSGTVEAPVFSPRTLALQGPIDRYADGVLTITSTEPEAVPEPATWAMFIGGFGLIGGAMRRRPRVAIRFA